MASKPLILVTGADQGLGYHAIQQLAATGRYHILMGSRDLLKADKTIDLLVADQSSPVDKTDLTLIQIDITDDKSIDAAATRVERDFGTLDMLLNNAGIATAQSASTDQTLRQAYHQQFDTNVVGAEAVTEAFLPLLQKGQSKSALHLYPQV